MGRPGRFTNTLSSAERRPTASAPIEDGRFAEARDLDARLVGSQAANSLRTAVSSTSPLAPRPPPSTISAGSATAAIGVMCEAMRRATSSTTLRPSAYRASRRRRSRACRREGRATSTPASPCQAVWQVRPPHPRKGRRLPPCRRARSRPRRRRRCDPGAALRRGPPGPEPGADGEEDEVLDTARNPAPLLAERGEVMSFSTVARTPSRRSSPERACPRARGCSRASATRSPPAPTTPGTPTTAPSIALPPRPQFDQRPVSSAAISSARAASAPASSTSWRARISPEVADRAAQKPGAEVQAEHRAASPTGSKRWRRSWAAGGRARPRARGRPRAATAAPATRSASRSRRCARPRAREIGARRGSPRAPCAR